MNTDAFTLGYMEKEAGTGGEYKKLRKLFYQYMKQKHGIGPEDIKNVPSFGETHTGLLGGGPWEQGADLRNIGGKTVDKVLPKSIRKKLYTKNRANLDSIFNISNKDQFSLQPSFTADIRGTGVAGDPVMMKKVEKAMKKLKRVPTVRTPAGQVGHELGHSVTLPAFVEGNPEEYTKIRGQLKNLVDEFTQNAPPESVKAVKKYDRTLDLQNKLTGGKLQSGSETMADSIGDDFIRWVQEDPKRTAVLDSFNEEVNRQALKKNYKRYDALLDDVEGKPKFDVTQPREVQQQARQAKSQARRSRADKERWADWHKELDENSRIFREELDQIGTDRRPPLLPSRNVGTGLDEPMAAGVSAPTRIKAMHQAGWIDDAKMEEIFGPDFKNADGTIKNVQDLKHQMHLNTADKASKKLTPTHKKLKQALWKQWRDKMYKEQGLVFPEELSHSSLSDATHGPRGTNEFWDGPGTKPMRSGPYDNPYIPKAFEHQIDDAVFDIVDEPNVRKSPLYTILKDNKDLDNVTPQRIARSDKYAWKGVPYKGREDIKPGINLKQTGHRANEFWSGLPDVAGDYTDDTGVAFRLRRNQLDPNVNDKLRHTIHLGSIDDFDRATANSKGTQPRYGYRGVDAHPKYETVFDEPINNPAAIDVLKSVDEGDQRKFYPIFDPETNRNLTQETLIKKLDDVYNSPKFSYPESPQYYADIQDKLNDVYKPRKAVMNMPTDPNAQARQLNKAFYGGNTNIDTSQPGWNKYHDGLNNAWGRIDPELPFNPRRPIKGIKSNYEITQDYLRQLSKIKDPTVPNSGVITRGIDAAKDFGNKKILQPMLEHGGDLIRRGAPMYEWAAKKSPQWAKNVGNFGVKAGKRGLQFADNIAPAMGPLGWVFDAGINTVFPGKDLHGQAIQGPRAGGYTPEGKQNMWQWVTGDPTSYMEDLGQQRGELDSYYDMFGPTFDINTAGATINNLAEQGNSGEAMAEGVGFGPSFQGRMDQAANQGWHSLYKYPLAAGISAMDAYANLSGAKIPAHLYHSVPKTTRAIHDIERDKYKKFFGGSRETYDHYAKKWPGMAKQFTRPAAALQRPKTLQQLQEDYMTGRRMESYGKVEQPQVDGFTYDQFRNKGWTDKQLLNSQYRSVVPSTWTPDQRVQLGYEVPQDWKPPQDWQAPTYQGMIDSGWTADKLKNDPTYKHLVPTTPTTPVTGATNPYQKVNTNEAVNNTN